MERLTAMATTLLAAQTQPLVPQPTSTSLAQPNTSSMPISTVFASTPQSTMVEGYLWSTPFSVGEVLHSHVYDVSLPTTQHAVPVPPPDTKFPQDTMTFTAPVVHTVQQNHGPVFHTGRVEADDRIDDLEEKFEGMQREVKALHGKRLFGKNAHDLCLVPNVVIPPKFKVPDFEKYKGNTCPKEHLVMYARKMSAEADNDKLLIHYFQDSLTGAASKWCMGLDSANIRTFVDLSEAFINQYNYNEDMAPDREELQAMTQDDKESFKAYAQRWREFAAQIRPPLEEKELTKIFLKTLDQFYYENMVARTPINFADMMTMGMRLDEGVREGRLVKENIPTDNSEEKGQEMSMMKGWPQQQYQACHPVAVVTPDANAVQNPGYQLQFQQYQQQPRQQAPQQSNPQNRAPRTQIDLIPIKYAELLPTLLKEQLVYTKAPLSVPARLPPGYRGDLSCAFHQGAPGHDTEHCFALKKIVQKLIRADLLSFEGSTPILQANRWA